jgi:eukaryotic-like serine/threonine-protein kinase
LLRAIATERPRPMTHADALGPAIDAMMDPDPARRWDMATCAKRLRGIADIGPMAAVARAGAAAAAVVPLLDPDGTQVLAPPVVEPTQRLAATAPPVDPTKHFDSAAPSVGPTQRLDVAASPLDSTKKYAVPAAPPDPTQRLGAVTPLVGQPLRLGASTHATKSDGRGSRQRWQPLAYAALLVAALGVAYLLTQLGGQGANTTAPLATSAATPAASARPAPTTPAPSTTSGAAQVRERPGSSNRGPKNKDLEKFVTSYYSEVTKDTDRTWDQLTPRMQGAAGGREGYDSFWRSIDKVEVNEFQVNASGESAVANLTFTRSDGTSSTESHEFTFVKDRGDYFIESDQFLG